MRLILWEQNRRLPRGVGAVLGALRLKDSNTEALGSLNQQDWEEALAFCDRTQLTLLLGHCCSTSLPEWAGQRVNQNLSDNSERLERIKGDVFEISDELSNAGTEYAILKGLTQYPRYVSDLRLRAQYDLDLFCPPGSLMRARDVILGLRYEPLEGFEESPIDHLPSMIRRTGWRWRGNYFDPEIPVSVDLHFRLWDEETERFRAPGVEEFWERRTEQAIDGHPVPVLHPADALAYNALHLLRHLLRGSLRPYHAYEIAYFLDAEAENETFWNTWCQLHEPDMRRLEAIAFRIAADWFGCRLAPVVEEEIHLLPSDVQLWFERYAASPVEGLFRPNKEELWLHVCLLIGFRHHQKVLRRRLIPMRMPGAPEPGGLPESQVTPRLRWATRLKYCGHVASRAAYHARVLLPTLWQGIRWWEQIRGPGGAFWRFLLSASLFNFGVFIFVLLYNLYLLDAGFQENFLGLITSAATLGSLTGALPAAWVMHRLGLQPTMLLCFAGTAVVSSLRSLVPGEGLLVSTAFLGGVLLSLWFVLVAPVVSGLTTEEKRPLGFSLFFAAGIGVGVLGGLMGGRLPGWLGHTIGLSSVVHAKQVALLTSCGITALACWPAAHLSLAPSPRRPVKVYPHSPFVLRFLLAISAWALAVGAFNPFFNAYFARHLEVSTARIGDVFSGSQLAQVVAVLLAPAVLRKLGLIGGIVSMQLAAAITLACLASGPPVLAAGILYAGYMSFQSMCEPGTYSLLMNQVAPAERGGASALNFLVIFASHAVAAVAAGAVVARFGYPVMLASAAAMAVVAAALFRGLLRNFAK